MDGERKELELTEERGTSIYKKPRPGLFEVMG